MPVSWLARMTWANANRDQHAPVTPFYSSLVAVLDVTSSASWSDRKLAVEKLRNKYTTWVWLCPYGGDFAVTGLVPCRVTPGSTSADSWAMLQAGDGIHFWPLRLMLSSTAGWSRDMCWCASGMTGLCLVKLRLSPKISPRLGSLSWVALFHFSPLFQICWGNIRVLQDLLLSAEHMLFQDTDWYHG